MVTDPIADFLTQLRNAARANKAEVLTPYSNIKKDIAAVFKKEGYIKEVDVLQDKNKKTLRVTMKVTREGKGGAIRGIKRISLVGRRTYVGSQDIPRVLGGLGVAIVSTSKGIYAGHEARKLNLGGELLCFIW